MSKILNYLAGKIRGQFATSKYEIKKGYIHRKSYNYFDSTEDTDDFQKEVYWEIKRLMQEHNLKTVIDFGCGGAYKLMTYLNEYNTIGVDVSPTYEHLKEKYPDKTWYNAEGLDTSTLSADIIVCGDVIEHVLDPDALLEGFKKVKGVKFIIISTPDRDMVRGKLNFGPPDNPTHVREWNIWEFNRYISKHFNVVEHRISDIKWGTQMIICTPK